MDLCWIKLQFVVNRRSIATTFIVIKSTFNAENSSVQKA